MPAEPSPAPDDSTLDPRARPRAVRELAGMFDGVSARYDLLNRLMTLGRDSSWRRAMGREVPEAARTVLDLCCGSGASLTELRRPGRLVIGVDVSLRMLELALAEQGRSGWAPRLVAADGFRLPLRGESLDAVTVAFGIRNLRPRIEALAEIGRVLHPGGRLVVLEGTAPRPGLLGVLHSFYLRRLVPLAGRLSPDPSAYAYLAGSILEFGSGPEFEADLARAGFEIGSARRFLWGAATLWAARLRAAPGAVQGARLGELPRGEMPHRPEPRGGEWRWWAAVKLALSASVLGALVFALARFPESGATPFIEPWQRSALWVLLIASIAGFAIRTVILAIRLFGPPPRG